MFAEQSLFFELIAYYYAIIWIEKSPVKGDDAMSLLQKPVAELVPLLKTKQVSPLELVRECLDRIKKTEPLVNAYISVLDESALTAAREAEQEILQGRYRGLLHGIPYSAKD